MSGLLPVLIWIADATEGDPEAEPDFDGEDTPEGCCDAEDDTGTVYVKHDGQGLPGAKRWGLSPGDPDDAEPSPPPGYLHRRGMWRGAAA